jgi:hypothetical protein
MNPQPDPDDSLVLSYLGLRKAVGIIGIALPFVLAFGKMLLTWSAGIEPSMSAYYYTQMGDVFVGSLCAIAVFLMSYRGYERQDRIASVLACIFGIGIALFPTAPLENATSADQLTGRVHLGFAALFFLTLAYFCLALFRKTDPSRPPTTRKLQRNGVYTVCGYTILACLALIVLTQTLLDEAAVKKLDTLFWLEAVCVLAFGMSWVTKGEAILKDL